MITVRRAVAADARRIGAVFDAAVADGWKYLGELARKPMFPPEEWDKLVTEHAPPKALLVGINESDEIAGLSVLPHVIPLLAALLAGGSLSLGSLVGFISLFGISARNSILLVSRYEDLVLQEGMAWGPGAALRKLLVGADGIAVESFLSRPVEFWAKRAARD